MPGAVFLLPDGDRFGGQTFGETVARAIGRADVSQPAGRERSQLARHVRLIPDHQPLAALARRRDANDAATACWLRADPAHIRPDINGARLLACGDALQLTREDADDFLRALKPLFGDAGFPIDAPLPNHWYLQLPRESRPPTFVPPDIALGDDVFEHLPDGDAGRRWRSLLSEAQVVLHNHPRNALRQERGLHAVNSLWFWGAGVLPDAVETRYAQVFTNDEALAALVHGVAPSAPLPRSFATPESDALFDLRFLRDLRVLESDWLAPAIDALGDQGFERLQLDLADGWDLTLRRRQRWRFWRSQVARFP